MEDRTKFKLMFSLVVGDVRLHLWFSNLPCSGKESFSFSFAGGGGGVLFLLLRGGGGGGGGVGGGLRLEGLFREVKG